MVSAKISGPLSQRDLDALCRAIDKSLAWTMAAKPEPKKLTPTTSPDDERLLLGHVIGNTIDLANDWLRDEKIEEARQALFAKFAL
jgi:hypothetical protein